MSYSFAVRAATAAAAVSAASAKLDEVVAGQPIHEADRAVALATVSNFVALVPERDDTDYSVNVSGSVYAVDGVLRGTSISVNVGMISKDA